MNKIYHFFLLLILSIGSVVAQVDKDEHVQELVKKACENYYDGDMAQAKAFIDSACSYLPSGIWDWNREEVKVSYYASLIYCRIGAVEPELDTLWEKKLSHFSFREHEWAGSEKVAIPFITDISADHKYERGVKYYNKKEYPRALDRLSSAILEYNYNETYNRWRVAPAYLTMAMCYAKIGELLQKPDVDVDRGIRRYKREWTYKAIEYAKLYKECNVECEDEDIKLKFIYETVGNALYNKAKIMFDNEFYQSANSIADSASVCFKIAGNNILVEKSHALAVRSLERQLDNRIPNDEIEWRSLDSFPETDDTDDNTYVITLGHDHYSCGNGCSCWLEPGEGGKRFKEYCNKTLGIPQEHVKSVGSVCYDSIAVCIDVIKEWSQKTNGNMNLLFYYYGAAEELEILLDDDEGDEDDNYCSVNIDWLLGELSEIKMNQTICLVDETFRYECMELLSAMIKAKKGDTDDPPKKKESSIKIKSKETVVYQSKEIAQGNMVAIRLSAVGVDLESCVECQGILYYYFLKELQRTKGDVTLGELYDYIYHNVRRESYENLDGILTPKVVVSPDLMATWRQIKL